MDSEPDNDASLLSPLFTDGRPFLTLGAMGLLFAGGFAIFLAATGHFLPHDTEYLGLTAQQLCSQNACKIVHFMIHDRVSFGGTLISLSILYLWLIHFPLKAREPWAWWTLLLSNVAGFGSFLTYLGFGYLDKWHALATVLLLPCFALGLALTFRTLDHPRALTSLLRPAAALRMDSRRAIGRTLLLATSFGLFCAGLTITVVGMTVVFVPQDLEYMETTTSTLQHLNPRLIPLIAHDRAGFGGVVLNLGLVLLLSTWCAAPSRHFRQAIALAGFIGFLAAIGIHPIVGYNNPVHLTPAVIGALCYFAGLALLSTRPRAAPVTAR